MKELFKKILTVPLDYGLSFINITVTEIITSIFNMYGNRLFNIENDKIIKKNEYIEDRNYVYLYPLQLNNIEQVFGLNSLKILKGSVNNSVLSIPWKSMMSDITYLNIENIDINIVLDKNEHSIYFTDLELSNSYLFDQNYSIKENTDLIETFQEIKNFITKYINQVEINISNINIIFNNLLKISISNIRIKNKNMYIENVTIENFEGINVVNIESVDFNYENNEMIIDKVKISNQAFDYFPIIYTDNSQSNYLLRLKINTLLLDNTILNCLDFHFDGNNIKLINILSATIDNVLIFNNNETLDHILIVDLCKKIVKVNKYFYVELINARNLILYVQNISILLNKVSTKLIVIDFEISPEILLEIFDLSIDILYNGSITHTKIKKISIDKNKILHGVFIQNDIFNLESETIVVDYNQCIKFNNFSLVTNKFKAKSDSIFVDNDKNIHFCNSDTNKVVDLIDFINLFAQSLKNELFFKSDNDNPTSNTILYFKNCKININENYKFRVDILNANVDINSKSAFDVELNLYIYDLLVSTIKTKNITIQNLSIDKISFYVDNKIIDTVFALLRLIKEDISDKFYGVNINVIEQLQESLLETFKMSEIIQNYQCQYSQHFNREFIYPNISFLTESTKNIDLDLFESYKIYEEEKQFDFKANIDKVYVYLFNKIEPYANHEKSFLFFVLKNITINKHTEYNEIISDYVTIIDGVNRKKSNKNTILKLQIGSIYAIDTKSVDPQWRYFIKFTRNTALISNIEINENTFKILVDISSVEANIRENTLLQFLTFFSNGSGNDDLSIFIESLKVNQFNVKINYFPLLMETYGSDKLSINNFIITLPELKIYHINGLDKIKKQIYDKWKDSINPDNYLQVIPNIKIIQPYTSTASNFIHVVSTYFSNPANRSHVRKLMKKISHSSIIKKILKSGKKSILELFS